MFYYYFDEENYEPEYVAIRKQLDSICRKITGRKLTPEEAHLQYQKIENEYALLEESRVELFKMIYESRITRLCNQFLTESV
jgi:hypothetical protein